MVSRTLRDTHGSHQLNGYQFTKGRSVLLLPPSPSPLSLPPSPSLPIPLPLSLSLPLSLPPSLPPPLSLPPSLPPPLSLSLPLSLPPSLPLSPYPPPSLSLSPPSLLLSDIINNYFSVFLSRLMPRLFPRQKVLVIRVTLMTTKKRFFALPQPRNSPKSLRTFSFSVALKQWRCML